MADYDDFVRTTGLMDGIDELDEIDEPGYTVAIERFWTGEHDAQIPHSGIPFG